MLTAKGRRESEMKYLRTTVFILAAAMSTGALAKAGDDDDNEESFDEARLFFELNDADGDLSIHGGHHAINAPGEIGGELAMKLLQQARYGANNNLRANARVILEENGIVVID